MARTRLPGYRRGGHYNRGYITPEGAEITYRAYRNRLEAAGAVQRLNPVDLANLRRRQSAFNRIVEQMVDVRGRAIDRAIDLAEEIGEDEEADDLREQKRTLKRTVIKSPSRKEALHELSRLNHKQSSLYERILDAEKRGDYGTAARLRAERRESQQAEAGPLKVLGRREGIPDWVPVGGSADFKTGRLVRFPQANTTGR